MKHLQNNGIDNLDFEIDHEDSQSHDLTEEEDSEGLLNEEEEYFSEEESYYIEGKSISKYEIIEVPS